MKLLLSAQISQSTQVLPGQFPLTNWQDVNETNLVQNGVWSPKTDGYYYLQINLSLRQLGLARSIRSSLFLLIDQRVVARFNDYSTQSNPTHLELNTALFIYGGSQVVLVLENNGPAEISPGHNWLVYQWFQAKSADSFS